MGAAKTCCGFYCAMTSLVGVYFFVILAIMEFRENQYLVQIVQNIEGKNEEQIDPSSKGTAFIITAIIEAVFFVLCYMCGMSSLKEDQNDIDAENAKQTALYQRVENQDPNQIVS